MSSHAANYAATERVVEDRATNTFVTVWPLPSLFAHHMYVGTVSILMLGRSVRHWLDAFSEGAEDIILSYKTIKDWQVVVVEHNEPLLKDGAVNDAAIDGVRSLRYARLSNRPRPSLCLPEPPLPRQGSVAAGAEAFVAGLVSAQWIIESEMTRPNR
jgi:hypothetical protein